MQEVLHIRTNELLEVVSRLKADGFVSCIDLTAVDYSSHPHRVDLPDEVKPERFEVVVSLISHIPPLRKRIRIQVAESNLEVPSLFDVYPGVEALEREVFDMFGIVFSKHPDMTRILMPDEWEGFPLRKDFPVGRVPVQFSSEIQVGLPLKGEDK